MTVTAALKGRRSSCCCVTAPGLWSVGGGLSIYRAPLPSISPCSSLSLLFARASSEALKHQHQQTEDNASACTHAHSAVMHSHAHHFIFCVWARIQKARLSYLGPLSFFPRLCVCSWVHMSMRPCTLTRSQRRTILHMNVCESLWVSTRPPHFFFFFFFFLLDWVATQICANRHSASHSALQLAENHGKNIDKQR